MQRTRFYLEVVVETEDEMDQPDYDVRNVLREYLDLTGDYSLESVSITDSEVVE